MRNYQCRRGRRRCAMMEGEMDSVVRGRPAKEIQIDEYPKVMKVIPEAKSKGEPIILTSAEYEAMRLIDIERLNQEETGQLMNISRGTVWRLLDSGRHKLMRVLVEGLELRIEEHGKV